MAASRRLKRYFPFVVVAIFWAISIHTVTAFLYSANSGRPFWQQSAAGAALHRLGLLLGAGADDHRSADHPQGQRLPHPPERYRPPRTGDGRVPADHAVPRRRRAVHRVLQRGPSRGLGALSVLRPGRPRRARALDLDGAGAARHRHLHRHDPSAAAQRGDA